MQKIGLQNGYWDGILLNATKKRRRDKILQLNSLSPGPVKSFLAFGDAWLQRVDGSISQVLRTSGDLDLLLLTIDVRKHDIDKVVIHL